jgi:hypothetical protein
MSAGSPDEGSTSSVVDLPAILQFEAAYRRQVGNRHKTVTPPHFDSARRVAIDDIYVLPDLLPAFERSQEPQRVSFAGFCSQIHRTVLLGDPGSGKSTFASKLCHDLATRFGEKLLARRQLTPIHVTLRDYGAEKKKRECSILQFIKKTAESVHQLPAPPPGAFENILHNGRAAVIFDGLDELLDTSYRIAITADIESFCALHPSVPVLVTSRKVGYQQAPLDPRQFDVKYLAPFNDEQSKEFVYNWFSLEDDLTAEQRADKADEFMIESLSVPDLRSNALLLALLCGIYRGEGHLPRNRPDVYEKCATMLFDRWDKNRGIRHKHPFEAHVRPTMMHLAHWIFSDEKRHGGVTESELVDTAAGYLCERAYRTRNGAEHAARAMVEFCRGRAWVFTDSGTTAAGERLYQFTHRTFLEYFTAAFLVRIHRSPEELLDTLLCRIMGGEWDLVAQLAFQLQNRQLEGAGDKLLSRLLEHVTDDERGRNVVYFAARCLAFIVPSPRITETIARTSLHSAIQLAKRWYPTEPLPDERFFRYAPDRYVTPLMDIAKENRDSVAASLKREIIGHVQGNNEAAAIIAFEIAYQLQAPRATRPRSNVTASPSWVETLQQQIYRDCRESAKPLLSKHHHLCVLAFIEEDVSIADLVEWHGYCGIFRQAPLQSGSYTIGPVFAQVFRALSRPVAPRRPYSCELEELGRILLASPPPLLVGPQLDFATIQFWWEPATSANFAATLGPEALFGVFALGAPLVEGLFAVNPVLLMRSKSEPPAFRLFATSPLASILAGRYSRHDEVSIQEELDQCRFSAEQQALVWRWVRREINLVEPPSSADSTPRLTRSQ